LKLLFKQKVFSWLDSYDIYDEQGNTVYTVRSKLAWGHCLKIFDAAGNELGTVKERVLTFMPKFEVYVGEQYLGCIEKELTLFKPKYDIDYNGWHIEGNLWEWDYEIVDRMKNSIATVSKEIFHFSDTYVIDVWNPENALIVLMFVLAIDAEKCSRS
jgi:uncharacterized protein YxjI